MVPTFRSTPGAYRASPDQARAEPGLALEAHDDFALGTEPGHPDRAEALDQREDPGIVAADRGTELDDAGRAGIGGELLREEGADALPLVRIRDRERDLRRRAAT